MAHLPSRIARHSPGSPRADLSQTDLGGAGDARLSAKLARVQLREVRLAGAQRLLAVAGLGIEQDVEPEAVDHGVEAARDGRRVQALMAAGLDHLLDQRAGALLVDSGPARAEIEEFLPPAGLAPEGVPHGHLLAA